MGIEETPNPPLACVPGGIPAAERTDHFALLQRLFQDEAQARQPLDAGYAFRFGAEAFDLVARFIANERRCCPFLTFNLRVTPPDGAVWLELTGPEGTREFLEAELPLQ